MSCEEGRIRDDEDSTSCLCSIIFSRITPFEDFTDISGTTHPNLAYDSHSLRQFLMPHQVQSLIKTSFHLYPIFPMMSHCVFALLLIFPLIYHLICHAPTIFVIWQYFMEFSLTHVLTHFLTHVEMLLCHSCFLLYIKRLSCLRERTI